VVSSSLSLPAISGVKFPKQFDTGQGQIGELIDTWDHLYREETMPEKHDLIHELPEYRDKIHDMKMNNAHFEKLFEQ